MSSVLNYVKTEYEFFAWLKSKSRWPTTMIVLRWMNSTEVTTVGHTKRWKMLKLDPHWLKENQTMNWDGSADIATTQTKWVRKTSNRSSDPQCSIKRHIVWCGSTSSKWQFYPNHRTVNTFMLRSEDATCDKESIECGTLWMDNLEVPRRVLKLLLLIIVNCCNLILIYFEVPFIHNSCCF